MARYQYEALDKNGRTVTGTYSAADEDELYTKLKEEGKYLLHVESGLASKKSHALSALMLSEFNRELSDMLKAGVTLVRALTILSQEETRKEKEREVLTRVLKLIRQGESVADAMEQQGGAFPLLMVNMYRAAETGGNLAGTAQRLAVHYEKEHQLGTKIKGATIYPRILLVLIVAVLIFIMSAILPQLSDLFDTMEELPAATRVLFAIGDFFEKNYKIILVVLVLMIIAVLFLRKMPAVLVWRDKMKLRIPIIGKLLTVIYTARFSRSLSSLYSSGIPIITALQVAKKTVGNFYIEKQFDQVLRDLRAGKPLSEAMDEVDGFRKKLASVIRVGEESGDLVQMLDSLADSFDYESEMAVNRILSYLEPALIVVMALVVGFIMIAVMMPIYSSYNEIGNTVSYY